MAIGMKTLPAPIRSVTIPKVFTVSQIVAAKDCFLKVLEKEDIERKVNNMMREENLLVEVVGNE